MKPKILEWYSSDVGDPEEFHPPSPDDFSYTLTLEIGIRNGRHKGADNFYVEVCTPKWIDRQLKDSFAELGVNLLIVPSHDFARVREFLSSAIEALEADSWEELALKISRIARWEFMDEHGRLSPLRPTAAIQ